MTAVRSEGNAASPLVSIVIPTFDRGALVVDAIESVLAQTWPHVEVIVVDDGSTDGTTDTLTSRFGSDPRVVLERQARAGPAAARNRGVARAAGAFIGFLDSDDVYLANCVETQLGVLESHTESDFVVADVRFVGAWSHGVDRLFAHPMWRPPISLEAVLAGAWASTCGWLLRAEAAQSFSFDVEFPVAEDTELIARYLAAGRTITVHDAVVAEYRGHDGSNGAPQLTSEAGPFLEMLYVLGERYDEQIPHAARHDLTTRRRIARHLADQGRWGAARPHIGFWWRRRFWRRTAWAYLLRSLGRDG